METSEIVAVVVVLIVLLAATVFLCVRCWRAVGEMLEDNQKPRRENFISSVSSGLRRSFRRSFHSSMRKMSGIRNSFRRSGSSKKRPAAVVGGTPVVATIAGLERESSELHPSFMKQTLRNEKAGEVRRGEASVADVVINDPTASMGGCIKPSPNPLYEPARRPAPLQAVQAHLSGYSRMEEDIVESPATTATSARMHYTKTPDEGGFTNKVYQEESPTGTLQRYDVPFEEAPIGKSTSPTSRMENAVELGQDSVVFTGDRSTYI